MKFVSYCVFALFAGLTIPMRPVGAAYPLETECEANCSRASNDCMKRCPSGEQGRGCRTNCGAADIECRQGCTSGAPSATAADSWTCSGPVNGCTSPRHKGETYGCAHKTGTATGKDDGPARRAAAENCEAELESIHGGGFFCRDTTSLTCTKDS